MYRRENDMMDSKINIGFQEQELSNAFSIWVEFRRHRNVALGSCSYIIHRTNYRG